MLRHLAGIGRRRDGQLPDPDAGGDGRRHVELPNEPFLRPNEPVEAGGQDAAELRGWHPAQPQLVGTFPVSQEDDRFHLTWPRGHGQVDPHFVPVGAEHLEPGQPTPRSHSIELEPIDAREWRARLRGNPSRRLRHGDHVVAHELPSQAHEVEGQGGLAGAAAAGEQDGFAAQFHRAAVQDLEALEKRCEGQDLTYEHALPDPVVYARRGRLHPVTAGRHPERTEERRSHEKARLWVCLEGKPLVAGQRRFYSSGFR